MFSLTVEDAGCELVGETVEGRQDVAICPPSVQAEQ